MNVLPLVVGFILILSFLIAGFIREQMFSVVEEKSIESFHKTSRIVLNSVAKRQYRRIKTAAPNPQAKKDVSAVPIKKEHGKYYSKRMAVPHLNNNKFNLSPLLQLSTDPKTHPLYQACASYMRILYEECLFKETQHLEYQLLDAWIKKYKSAKEVKAFSDLYPETPELQQLFYKMLKGTNQYDVEKMRGIPPFEDFFYLSPHTEKAPAISFASASPPLLEALFGKKNALKILGEEKKKWESSGAIASLSQGELSSLLSHDHKASSLVSELGSLLDFSQINPKRDYISGADKTSGLTIKKKCGG